LVPNLSRSKPAQGGWKLVGELTDVEMRELPSHVLTSLLPFKAERQGRDWIFNRQSGNAFGCPSAARSRTNAST
jgi:hypothetical protein